MAKKIFVEGLVSGYMTPEEFHHFVNTSQQEDEFVSSKDYVIREISQMALNKEKEVKNWTCNS